MIDQGEAVVITATFVEKDYSEAIEEPVEFILLSPSGDNVTGTMEKDEQFSEDGKHVYRGSVVVEEAGGYRVRVESANNAVAQDFFVVKKDITEHDS